ncbi:MAG: class D beta-lactamase, partial [Flavobacteriaceae bacterium]|nr:class D beta-lactamase [Flavobacteriaceae bacterium]
KSTYQTMKDILQIEINKNYILSGKTGWSTSNKIDNGWFVGYLESNKNVYFFATNIEPNKNFNMDLFAKIRKTVTIEALKSIGVIK